MVDFIKCLTEVENYGICPVSTFKGVEEVSRCSEELCNTGSKTTEAMLVVFEPAMLVQVSVK